MKNDDVPRYVVAAPIPAVPGITELTYAVPDSLATHVSAGKRLVAPLGRRRVTVLALRLTDEPPEGFQVKDVESVLDTDPIVPTDLIELALWMSEYYLAGFSEVLSLALGRGLTAQSQRRVTVLDASLAKTARERDIIATLQQANGPMEPRAIARVLGTGSADAALKSLEQRGALKIETVLEDPRVRARFETVVHVARTPDEAAASEIFRRAPRRRDLYEYVAERPGRTATLSELNATFASARSAIDVLVAAGLLRSEQVERYRTPQSASECTDPPTLSDDQRSAVDAVVEALGGYRAFLLQGVTASGKTEVYLHAIERALADGKSALVLVPEISLTHQLLARLTGRFGSTVAVLHSELSAGERWDEWRRLSRGEARIAIGARSAVLGPLDNLGLIVVDEEHDGSYKQGDGVRYHGRDVAVMRARMVGCPIVLGSATPSLESWANADVGRYDKLVLPKRVTPNPPPSIEVVDIRGRDIVAHAGICDHLAVQVQRNFERKGQTLLFLNRRGYASHFQCYECGEILECDHCSVGMTLHQKDRSLRCHHCNAHRPIPERCPSCNRDALLSQGLGTQKLEDAVRRLIPAAKVARMDRDATAAKGATASILQDWKHGRFDVLIGTQMIAKGHDVPGVTLVGVVQADLALSMPDFRAAERTVQLLEQVAGRAGRGEDRGRVILQTYQPDHPAIAAAAKHQYDDFCRTEIEERGELGYPPLQKMIMLRFTGAQLGSVERMASQAARLLTAAAEREDNVTVRGPAPAVVERIKARYRFKLQLRGPSGQRLRALAVYAKEQLSGSARSAGVHLIVDVDPLDLL